MLRHRRVIDRLPTRHASHLLRQTGAIAVSTQLLAIGFPKIAYDLSGHGHRIRGLRARAVPRRGRAFLCFL